MEINGLGSNYTIQSAQTEKNNSQAESFEDSLNSAVKSGDDAALKKSCKDFESIMLSMMYKSMRATVDKSDLVKEDQGMETFQSMLDDEIIKNASEAGGIGLADVLYKQLKRQSSTDKTSSNAMNSSDNNKANSDSLSSSPTSDIKTDI